MYGMDKKIIERLKYARELLGLTQAELANLLGLKGAAAISKWEKEQREIKLSIMDKLATALQTNKEWLLTGEVKKAHSEALNAIYVLWKERAENLSEKVGVPQEYIDAIRNNEISPSETLIKKIEHATGFALDVPEKKVENEQCKDNDYLKKENEDLKKERDWLRKQNEDLLQIVKSLRKD